LLQSLGAGMPIGRHLSAQRKAKGRAR
jgi:hypothetical protein